MEKEFIPYEEALALKELGFGLSEDDYIELSSFYEDGKFYYNEVTISEKYNPSSTHLGAPTINNFEARVIMMDNSLDNIVLAPTFSQAFRWFREKYHLNTSIVITQFGQWWCKMEGSQRTGDKFDTYEEAELACLRKLIEIVKQKE